MIPALYHYTCDHGHTAIGHDGLLLPVAARLPHLFPGKPGFRPTDLVWLTTLAAPDRYALGLTSTVIRCDRTRYRYRVAGHDRAAIYPWFIVRDQAPAEWRAQAEAPPHDPVTWWVSQMPVPVTFDPVS